MAMQESNEGKFFSWLKTKVTPAQCQEMQEAKSVAGAVLSSLDDLKETE